jgi:hypothetical protein
VASSVYIINYLSLYAHILRCELMDCENMGLFGR